MRFLSRAARACLLLVALALLAVAAPPAGAARLFPRATVLAERPALVHGIAGDRRLVFVTEPGIGPGGGTGRVVALDRYSGREVGELPPPPGGFKLPFTLRVPRPGHLVVLDAAGFPPQGPPAVYDYEYAYSERAGLQARPIRTVSFAGLPLAFAEDVEVLPDGEYVVSESVIGGLWLIGRNGTVRPGLVPSGPAPLPGLGPCAFPAEPAQVGQLAFRGAGGFAPGAGSLAVRRDQLYFSSTCHGGVQRLPLAVLRDQTRPAEERAAEIETVAPREHRYESLKGIQFNRWRPRSRWLYAGDPFRLQLVRIDVRTGRRQVLSTDDRLFDFTVSLAFLPPVLPGLPNPLVTASDQEYRSALLNATLTADAFRPPFVMARYFPPRG